MTLDDFWRLSYRRMVNYCASFGHAEEDIEEVVADVIHARFDEYAEKIAELNGGVVDYNRMRHWMNRRVLLDVLVRYRRFKFESTGHDTAQMGDTMGDDVAPQETLHWDTPENIFCLAQRLPPVHPILLDYEPFGIREEIDGPRKPGGPKGANTNADKTKFCRERKKFMQALAA